MPIMNERSESIVVLSPSFEVVDRIDMPSGYGIGTGVIDKVNGFIYFEVGSSPGRIIKVSTNPLAIVADILLNPGENWISGAVIDTKNGFAYFPYYTSSNGGIVKIDLNTFTRVDPPLILPWQMRGIEAGVIDEDRGFAYFGGWITGYIGKINLNTFTLDAMIQTSTGGVWSACIDKANNYAYFGASEEWTYDVIKIDLNTFTEVEGILFSDPKTGTPSQAYIDQNKGFAYFANYYINPLMDKIVKVDISNPSILPPIEVSVIDGAVGSSWPYGVIDTRRGYIYQGGDGTWGQPGTIAKIKLDTFQKVETLPLQTSGERFPDTGVIDEEKGFAYFGCMLPGDAPARIIKINIGEKMPTIIPCIIKRDEGIYSKPKYCYIGEGIFIKK